MDGYLLDITHPDPFQKWALIIAGILTVIYVVMRPMRKRKDPMIHGPSLSLAGQREVEKQMTELVVELEKMARQMTSQLDTRAAKLELLIREADEKIAALRSTDHSPPQTIRVEPAQIRQALLPDNRHTGVYELADQGQTPRQIAQQLSRPYGEIELILALRGHESAPIPCEA
jgi:hypothetical protein